MWGQLEEQHTGSDNQDNQKWHVKLKAAHKEQLTIKIKQETTPNITTEPSNK